MKIIQRVQRLEDEWAREDTPEYFWVVSEENEDVSNGIWYDTADEAARAYRDLPEGERY